jgi:chromosome segregation ATPase
VHLRAIKLRGFKSFPDTVEVRLEPGVAVVVGPNGSGKSNVADALVWAAGSQAPSELRAERADDVLFGGSAERPAADFCEVELLFDNVDGALPVDFTEVSVARRLHRGGEGQYLLNGASVRRLDVVELLADVGLGAGTGSIVGQGRVEAVLASRPEERRALVEEAAGLGRFKRRRHRAELKLARVSTQVERARDLEAEVAKRLRPLALQATAAERAEKLGAEIAALRAGIATHDLAGVERQLSQAGGRREAAAAERRKADEQLETLLAERTQAEEALAEAAGGRQGGAATAYLLRSARERLELRLEGARELAARLREAPAPRTDERTRLAKIRAEVLERALAEREGLPPAARALAEQGAQLALDLIQVEPGYEKAVAAALGHRAAALVAGNVSEGVELLKRASVGGLGNLTVLVDGPKASSGSLLEHVTGDPRVTRLLADIDVVQDLGSGAKRPSVTRKGEFYDPGQGELSFSGEAAEAVLLELEARHRQLLAEAEAAPTAPRPLDPELVAAGGRLCAILERTVAAVRRHEEPLAADAESATAHAGELAAELRRLGAAEVELRKAAAESGERASAIDVDVARLDAEARDLRRRLAETGAEPAEGERDELAAKLARLERRRELLGGVNPFAKEEYAREKERLAEISAQRADLETSLAELEKLRRELTETVDQRFAETFAAVRDNFAEVAATLFPGGEGRLRLTDPEEADAEPGIEVELRPAGKRITRLSLLSGGEKALGAIAFLFALFLARPCPFYLLDEVEAALDDANIGRFVELLRRFADRAQFIVITHQKRTMEAADVLYGVTMGPDGVSQVVSRRLSGGASVAA